jgi:hypothetical protein
MDTGEILEDVRLWLRLDDEISMHQTDLKCRDDCKQRLRAALEVGEGL